VSIKKIDYDKLRDYLNKHVDLYSYFINTYVNSKDTSTYLLTIKDSNNKSDVLKKFMPNLLKKLRKEDYRYFSGWEIGRSYLLHNHVDVVCNNDVDLELIVQKYMNHNKTKMNFGSVSVQVKKIKHKKNYSYITKKFDVNNGQSLGSLDCDGFRSYIKRISQDFRLYSLFSFHFK